MDIEKIRKALKDFIEIEDVFDLRRGCEVRYITLKNDEEIFLNAGQYTSMGKNIIRSKKGAQYLKVPIEFTDEEGRPYYKTRVFMKEQLPMTKKNFNELIEIVDSQQKVINKLLRKIKEYERMC